MNKLIDTVVTRLVESPPIRSDLDLSPALTEFTFYAMFADIAKDLKCSSILRNTT